ncbi:MAG TPA: hypothetical protein VFK05_07090 [Polyangiaceae bacterium]|nr:hypothetical protein [Polyangiaceae bacterium]
MKYRAVLWALGAAWLVFACGSAEKAEPRPGGGAGASAAGGSSGGHISGEPSSAAPIAIQDLCPIFTHDLCTYFMQCGGARYRDAAHCERELTCYGLPELTAAAERGAIDYDPSKVGACHERFTQSPCTFGFFLATPNIYDVLQFCPGTVTPKLKAGDSCSASGECSSGLYCYKGANYTCPGTCKAFSQLGEDCAGSGRCADGLRCNDNQCVAADAAGSSCTDFCSYSVTCPEDQVCPTNVWCDRAAGKCQSGRLEGEPCGAIGTGATASTAECAVHLWCDALSFASGTCRKPSGPGGPCNTENSACEAGLRCVGYDGVGATAALGTCRAPGPVGADCEVTADCSAGLTCSAGHCQQPGAADAACHEDVDCQTGLVCLGNLCTPARYPGDSCSTGVCTYSRCVNGTCDYHAQVGEACASPSDCATSRCVAGRCYDDSLCKAPM